MCHRLDLSTEHHGDREDVRPLDEPHSLIETEFLDFLGQDCRHEYRDIGVHTEAIFSEFLHPAIAPCLRIFRLPGDDSCSTVHIADFLDDVRSLDAFFHIGDAIHREVRF